jgi:adenosylcobyric acid synthase
MTEVSVPPPGPHGDDARRAAAALGLPQADILDLATSLNPVASDARLVVAGELGSLRNYPDAAAATGALGEAMGVAPEHLLLTNGGSEAIALVAGELGAGWVDEPDFSLYRRHLSAVLPGAPRWRSNPHNPSGRLAPAGEQAAVWDEAFYPLSTGEWTRGDARHGSVVIGSLTKLFACPGLRLGYVLSEDAELLQRLANRQPRWSVGSLGLAAVPRLLETADLIAWSKQIATLRAQLVDILESTGLQAEPSDANFVLVRSAAGLRDRLARHGIVVRDCTSFGMPGVVRIAVPSPDGLARLEAALRGRNVGDTARPPTATRLASSPVDATAPSAAAPSATAASAAAPSATAPSAAAAGPRLRPSRLRGALMVCGTASDVGKSQIVTGLCRLLARSGVSVAPFKAQNMSLNSFATASGHEIGRAQGVQALAARTAPEVAMNPILLKPTGERRSQVVVMGRPVAELDAADYQGLKRDVLWPVVIDAYEDLRERFDVVVCEGAGSPAEINLLDGDIANLTLAAATGMSALLVGDIERGGVFAALYGTMTLLPAELSSRIGGFVINKFRGDASLLTPGLEELERRTGVPTLGVLPFVHGLSLDAEDSLGLAAAIAGSAGRGTSTGAVTLDVVAVALPHLANFTDLDALALEPDVALRMASSPSELGDPDVVLLLGSKTTVADLEWLRSSGLAASLAGFAADPDGPTVVGICAGYQMLGSEIVDEFESRQGQVEGLGILSVRTGFTAEKLARPRHGTALGETVTGYEIRQGRPVVTDGSEPLAVLEDSFGNEPEGVWLDDGRLAGTNLHGLFESDGFRHSFLARVARRRGKPFAQSPVRFAEEREAQIDRLADLIADHLDVGAILDLIAAAPGASS